MERITEMRKLAAQMEFARGVPPFELVNGKRWLVRSGPLTQMLNRGDDVKLTFGKRFTKIPIHLFLFNDIIIVAKNKGLVFFKTIYINNWYQMSFFTILVILYSLFNIIAHVHIWS